MNDNVQNVNNYDEMSKDELIELLEKEKLLTDSFKKRRNRLGINFETPNNRKDRGKLQWDEKIADTVRNNVPVLVNRNDKIVFGRVLAFDPNNSNLVKIISAVLILYTLRINYKLEVHKNGKKVDPYGEEVSTPAQAAKIVGVSRAHFRKILDQGAVPYRIVGVRDRRVKASDLAAYVRRTEELRAKTAWQAAHMDDLKAAALAEM